MDTISNKIRDTQNNMFDIQSILNTIKFDLSENIENTTENINQIKEKIRLLQQDEIILNQVVPLSKSDGTAKILKNNFKHLYNKQYTKNATLIVGILIVSGIIIKMSFYETIDYPRVL
jgi:hypothetical protein